MRILRYDEYITEGLILSHDINKVIKIIQKMLNDENIYNKINILNNNKYELDLTLFDYDLILKLNKINNILGYFPSLYDQGNIKHKSINDIIFDKNLTISYESKFDTSKPKKYEKMYHLSPSKNRENILKKGLKSKSNNRLTSHPERIYLFSDYNNYNLLLVNLKKDDFFNKNIQQLYDLYEIKIESNINLHDDPNYIDGYYTYDLINKNNIKIIIKDI